MAKHPNHNILASHGNVETNWVMYFYGLMGGLFSVPLKAKQVCLWREGKKVYLLAFFSSWIRKADAVGQSNESESGMI